MTHWVLKHDIFVTNWFLCSHYSHQPLQLISMETSQTDNGTPKCKSNEVKTFAEGKHSGIRVAFVDLALERSLKQLVPGKRALDIGCGFGNWSDFMAKSSAKKVDGFDAHEEMVELAKANSQMDTVTIQLGDAAHMSYNDASFDIAISVCVTCCLPSEKFPKHFQELYRVLAPGGKAIVAAPSNFAYSKTYTTITADATAVNKEMAEILSKMPKHPTAEQVNEAFKHLDDVIITCLALDEKGNLFRVENINQLTDGQSVFRKSFHATHLKSFQSEQAITDQIHAAGLCIDEVENCYTEERRVAYNSTNPTDPVNKGFVEYPPLLIYHVSKPTA